MPFYDYKCETCGTTAPDVLRTVETRDSENPVCEGHGPMERVWLSTRRSITTDDIPGGMWLENYGPNPVKVYSHTERKALMKNCVDNKGRHYQLEEMVRHVGVPGSDKSPHTTNWASRMDPYTLANAIELVTRASLQKGGKTQPSEGDEGYNDTNFADPSVEHFVEAHEGGSSAIQAIQEALKRG